MKLEAAGINTLLHRVSELESMLAQVQSAPGAEDQRALLWSILEGAHQQIWALDKELNGVYFNRAWQNFRSRFFADEIGKGWQYGIHPEDLAGVLSQFAEGARTCTPFRFAARVQAFGGTYFQVLFSASPRFDLQQNFIGFCGIAQALTDLAPSEDIESPEEKYRLLVENVNDGIVISQDDRFVFLNSRFATMLGYSVEELSQLTYRDLYTEEGLEILYERRMARERGAVVPSKYETALRRRDGSRLYVEVNVNIMNYQGNLATFAVVRDMSEKRQMEWERNLFSMLALELGSAESLAQIGQILRSVSEKLITWDAFGLSLRASGSARFRCVTFTDTVDGQKKDFAPFDFQWKGTPTVEALHRGEPVLLHRSDIPPESDMQLIGNTAMVSASLIYVPIASHWKLIGFITVQSYRRNFYSERDVKTLMRMAEMCCPIVERAVAEKRSAAFSALGKRLSAARTPEEVARIVVMAADDLLGWDAASINNYYAETQIAENLLSFDIINGQRQEVIPPLRIGEPSAIQKETVRTGAQLLNRDQVKTFPGPTQSFGDASRPSESMMFVPLRKGKDVVGILTIQSYTQHAYDEQDLEILQALADHCSGALERTRVERQLGNSEERFRNLVEASKDAILEVTPEGRVVYANSTARELLGLVEGRNEAIPELLSEESAKDFQEFLDEIRRAPDGASRTTTWSWKCQGRQELHTENKISAIRDDRGHATGCLVIARDTTERLAMEERQKALDAQIQQTQKFESMSVLAGGIAHDFNNLLTGILGNSELALMDIGHGTPTAEALRQIELAAQRAAELTKQMLAYAGKGKFLLQPINLSRIVKEMADLLQSVISSRAHLRYDLDARLPYVEADSAQVRQVVMNVVTNASDALEGKAGDIVLKTGMVTLTSEQIAGLVFGENLQPGDFVYIESRDGGCGIDDETRARMFEPFFTRKPTGLVGGRGLGLAAVAGIVRKHRGAISVESVVGEGTTFTVYFPVTTGMPHAMLEGMLGIAMPKSTGTALVVDDEQIVRTVAASTLRRCGYTVLEARDGQEGLETFIANQDKIDLVLLDLRMPRLPGEKCFHELRRLRPTLPVVVMTGYTEQEVSKLFDAEKHVQFVEKPFSPKILMGKIQELRK